MLTYYFHGIPDNAALNPQSEIDNYENIAKYIEECTTLNQKEVLFHHVV